LMADVSRTEIANLRHLAPESAKPTDSFGLKNYKANGEL
jgi:hypothetical protein